MTLSFKKILEFLTSRFITDAYRVESKKWQAIDSPMGMRELLNQSIAIDIPEYQGELALKIEPNMPWAEIHFEERISGEPLNTGESYKQWPFYKMDKDMRRADKGLFSHTYMERIWPKFAGELYQYYLENTPENDWDFEMYSRENWSHRAKGIRYHYGDLNDVIQLLKDDPFTRQAYLPIFFPEDTGNTMNERIPCTIGYHFIMRDKKLHIIYYIRSCDYIRHFKDDVYLACRLVQWVLKQVGSDDHFHDWYGVKPGTLTMHITSLHIFESDTYRILKENEKNIKG